MNEQEKTNLKTTLGFIKKAAKGVYVLALGVALLSFIAMPIGLIAMVWNFEMWRIPITALILCIFSTITLILLENVVKVIDEN